MAQKEKIKLEKESRDR
jgi:hypothetical protein